MHDHYQSLGGWTLEFEDYYELGVTKYLDTPEIFEMQKVVDPYCKFYVLFSQFYIS